MISTLPNFRRTVSCLLGFALFTASSAPVRADLWGFAEIYNFGADVGNPKAALVQGTDGNFYGTTASGGAQNRGTVFSITPDGTETVLYSFGAHPNDGYSPQAELVQGSDGNFYGMTPSGGALNNGTVFKVTPAGVETVLYSFGTNPNDGAAPQSGLVQGSEGNFYGTTLYGGDNFGSFNSLFVNGLGTVFKITPDGTETVLHVFGANGDDGANPQAALIQASDGNFYGTTTASVFNDGFGPGTAFSDSGTVFKITPDGTEAVLYVFGATADDGDMPEGALVQGSDDDFYGTMESGGTQGYGVVFRITPGGDEAVIYSFGTNPNDGIFPAAGLVQGSDGNFYGTTESGGIYYYGSAFQITPAGDETLLYSFSGDDGGTPQAALVAGADGNFYGTTPANDYSDGAVVGISLSGDETLFYGFGTNPDDGRVDGYDSQASLVLGSDGNFYGTTAAGGSYDEGTVFAITPGGLETVLYSFGAGPNDGTSPQAALVEGDDGNFYGTTFQGGANGLGTVFRITPGGSETVLYSFGTNLYDGAAPQAALLAGGGGTFYGTTSSGGSFKLNGAGNNGIVFKITTGGEETVLYVFGADQYDGATPQGALVESGGVFYGTTSSGGKYNEGCVFSVTPGGVETVLYSFDTFDGNPNDGVGPEAGLVAGPGGSFYGTTYYGGANGFGTVFKITERGDETVLYSFGTNPYEGLNPQAALILGGDGNFYGTTVRSINYDGSVYENGGAVFSVTPGGSETVVYSLGINFDGSNPQSALVEGPDGNLYGTTSNSGTNESGTVFRVTTTGSLSVTISGLDSADVPGAMWQVDGGAPQPNRATVSGLWVGAHTVSFTSVAGYATPPNQAVNIYGGGSDSTFGVYDSFAFLALQDWRAQYFPGSTPTDGPGADDATPQNDGVPNIIKFATGLNPNAPANMPGAVSVTGNAITFTYTPSATAVAAGVVFAVEYSDSLEADSWTSTGVDQGNFGSGGSPVTATIPIGPDHSRFVRLRVTVP